MRWKFCSAAVIVLVAVLGGFGAQEGSNRVQFQGKWSGNWENTFGEKGTETLTLEESADGLLSGTYWEDSKIKGERVGNNTFTFEAQTASRRYRIVGRVEGTKLLINYAATPLDGGQRYYGWSVLEMVK